MYGSSVNGGLMSHVRKPSLSVSVRSTRRGTAVMLGEYLRSEDREQVGDRGGELGSRILARVIAAELEPADIRDRGERDDRLAQLRERHAARGREHDRAHLGRVDDVDVDVQPDLPLAREGDDAGGVRLLRVETDARDLRAVEVPAFARIQGAATDQRDVLLGDLLRARPEKRRDGTAARMREAHAADVVGRRRREGVEVAVGVEVDEREVRHHGERTRQAARDERALPAEHRAGGAGAQGRADRLAEGPAGLARRAYPAVAWVEGNADVLLRPESSNEVLGERARSGCHPREACLRDHSGLEEMQRTSRHKWAHLSALGRLSGSLPDALEALLHAYETALDQRQANDRDGREREARPASGYEHQDPADECDEREQKAERDRHGSPPCAALLGDQDYAADASVSERSEEPIERCQPSVEDPRLHAVA